MSLQLSFAGFGEAARAFAPAIVAHVRCATAYDIRAEQATYQKAFGQYRVKGSHNPVQSISSADIILSLVTADQQRLAAEQVASSLRSGALYCDMNSVAPDSKRQAAVTIETAGGHYVDVAIMSPVYPKRHEVALLISGVQAQEAEAALRQAGFTDTTVVGEHVGQASTIKMIRSVMVKGIEALTAEMILAAQVAGVRDQVLGFLDASEKPSSWRHRADYNLDRMLTHGHRRAAEMREVTETLRAIGVTSAMSEQTANWQERLAALEISPVPDGLPDKVDAILGKELYSGDDGI